MADGVPYDRPRFDGASWPSDGLCARPGCEGPGRNRIGLCPACYEQRRADERRSAEQGLRETEHWQVFREQWRASDGFRRDELERRFLKAYPHYTPLTTRWLAHERGQQQGNKPRGKGGFQ